MNLQLFAQKKEKKMEDQRTPMPELSLIHI